MSGDSQPVVAETAFETLINTWHRVWTNVRKDINQGNSMLNCNSAFLAMRKKFAGDIQLPINLISPARYLYCLTREKNLEFRFAPDAVIYFRLPPNLHDYVFQQSRYGDETEMLTNRFGKQILSYYQAPVTLKIKSLLISMVKNPLFVIPAAVQHVSIRLIMKNKRGPRDQGPIKTIASTKQGIKPIYFNKFINS